MKRFLFSRLLCIALSVLLPLTALAQDPNSSWLDQAREEGKQIATTFTITPGEVLAAEPAVADLLKAIAFGFFGQKESFGGFALLMGGKEVFALNMDVNQKGLYAQSAILGESVVFIEWDGLQKLLEETMESVAPGSSASVAAQFQSFGNMMSGNIPNVTVIPQSPEEKRAQMLQVFGNDESMANWVDGLMNRMAVTQGEFTDPNHDPATEKTEVLITQEDIVAIFDTQYMRNMFLQQLRSSSPGISEELLQAQVDQLLTEGKNEISKASMQIPITVLTSGEDLIALEMPMVIQTTQSSWDSDKSEWVEVPMTVSISIHYYRLTNGDAKNHSFALKGEAEGTNIISLAGTCNETDDKHWNFSGDLTVDADVLNLKGSSTTEDNAHIMDFTLAVSGVDMFRLGLLLHDSSEAYDVQVDLYATPMLLGGSPDSPSLANAKPIVSFNTHTIAQDADDRFEALLKATPETALNLIMMSPEEQAKFVADINLNAMKVLYAIMAELPESALSLVSGMFN